MAVVTIPEYITVHLGRPNQPARNVTVPFIDYIKNVASSEIYPTWPENAIRANIYAQVTFALNRIFTEYYRSRGYDFDITNSTQYDQAYVDGRDIFTNISRLVDELFNDYVTKGTQIQPYFTQYCNGTTVTCDGLSQWGTVPLARQGRTPYEILQNYYGDDINIVRNAPISANIPSYPGVPFRLGSAGEEVVIIQRELNRIARNYPAIPRIPENGGIYDLATENSVRAFQDIFNLNTDGIVGKETWYQLKRIYYGVKSISDLYSEGLNLSEVERRYERALEQGDTGVGVWIIQYYLAFIGFFNDSLPQIEPDGVFGNATENAVRQFQEYYGLTVDGIVGRQTWNKLQEIYSSYLAVLPSQYNPLFAYPGYILTTGATGPVVEQLQRFINTIANNITSVPNITVDGIYGEATANAVRAIQNYEGLNPTGAVNPLTWDLIIELYNQYR